MSETEELIPVEFNVIVELDPTEEKIGSILLTHEKVERNRLEETVGTLTKLSPLAFGYDEWPEGARKPQSGDRVYFARYAGILTEIGGKWVRIIKDKDVVAVVDRKPSLSVAA